MQSRKSLAAAAIAAALGVSAIAGAGVANERDHLPGAPPAAPQPALGAAQAGR